LAVLAAAPSPEAGKRLTQLLVETLLKKKQAAWHVATVGCLDPQVTVPARKQPQRRPTWTVTTAESPVGDFISGRGGRGRIQLEPVSDHPVDSGVRPPDALSHCPARPNGRSVHRSPRYSATRSHRPARQDRPGVHMQAAGVRSAR
jgi:hypothetical protein